MSNKALIVVDVQNDFIEGGALAVTGGRAVADELPSFLTKYGHNYDLIVFSQDWHKPMPDTNEDHFAVEPNYVTTWPVHCVQETLGAALVDPLQAWVDMGSEFWDVPIERVYKGQGEAAYSAFQGINAEGKFLDEIMSDYLIGDVDVCGLATDYCVKATAIDADRASVSRANVLLDLCAGVSRITELKTVKQLSERGINCTNSWEVGLSL